MILISAAGVVWTKRAICGCRVKELRRNPNRNKDGILVGRLKGMGPR